jgi:hypothetical protein
LPHPAESAFRLREFAFCLRERAFRREETNALKQKPFARWFEEALRSS